MKIRFLEDTYIRSAPGISGDPPIGIVFKGNEIEVEPIPIFGASIENNYYWYCDKLGRYYWSGRTELVAEPEPVVRKQRPEALSTEPASLSEPELPVERELSLEQELLSEPELPVGMESPLESESPIQQTTEENFIPQELIFTEKTISGGIPLTTMRQGPLQSPLPILTEHLPGDSTQLVPDTQINKPETEEPAGFGENLLQDRLNWGIRNYSISQEWWLNRRLTGKAVRIALLSTGVDPDHPDLKNIEATFQFPDSSQQMKDLHGLGTQAAIVAAGVGQTVFGLAPEASLLIAKIGEQDHVISPEGLYAGLSWAIKEKADIIGMLVDFPSLDEEMQQQLQDLIDQAVNRGIILVAPVGTVESKKPEKRYPASLKGVVSIGAHDPYGQRCAFSAKSFKLDLLAPGEKILSSTPRQIVTENMRSVGIAAAFMAGFLALIRQGDQDRKLTTDAIFDLLRDTAAYRKPYNKGQDVEYGYGILNPIEILKKLDSLYKKPEM